MSQENNKYRTGALIGLGMLGLFAISNLLGELPLLPEEQKFAYAMVRIGLIVTLLPLGYLLWRNYASVLANTLIGIHFMIYTLHGQWHRPLYYFAFFQLGIAYSFVFSPPKRVFQILMPAWTLAFTAVFYLRWDQFCLAMQNPKFSEIATGIIVVGVMSWISYYYFTDGRNFREMTVARFSRMGFHSSRIIHDLKGLSSAPRLYAGMLREKFKDHSDPELTEALTALSRDLENIENVVRELNQMIAVRQGQNLSDFTFEEVLDSVRTVLGDRLKNVSIENQVNVRLRSDKALLSSIVLNLILNSLDAFKLKQIQAPTLRIQADKSSLTFSDNAGGFEPDVLKDLTQGNVYTTKANGSGLGLWMVMDGMTSLGGKVKIKNIAKNAYVSLVFPKKSLTNLA